MFIKKSEYEEMTEKINIQQGKIEDLKENIANLKNKLNGDRVCDGYCSQCKHSYKDLRYPSYEFYGCMLDCKCKDFEEMADRLDWSD